MRTRVTHVMYAHDMIYLCVAQEIPQAWWRKLLRHVPREVQSVWVSEDGEFWHNSATYALADVKMNLKLRELYARYGLQQSVVGTKRPKGRRDP